MNQVLAFDRKPDRPFEPMRPLRNGILQTVLTTTRWDVPESLTRWGIPLLVDAGPDETGEDDGGVRLLAYFTAAAYVTGQRRRHTPARMGRMQPLHL